MPDYFAMLLGETPAPSPKTTAAAPKAVAFKVDAGREAKAYWSTFKGRTVLNVEVDGAEVLHLSALKTARVLTALEALKAAGIEVPKVK